VIDVVDNCVASWNPGDPDFGPFSRYDTNHSNAGIEVAYPAIGPFDQLRPNTSFLPDGKLDEGDAPMPALRVDLDTTGGVGELIKADKTDIFIKDASESASTNHNLYAPFYKALVPAVVFGEEGQSGTSGALGNNFPGYAFLYYDYWDVLLEEEYSERPNLCKNPLGDTYAHPYNFVNSLTVYTDEHGQAYVGFDPVPGNNTQLGAFVLPHIPPSMSGINIICDLSPGEAGRTVISAKAFYPDQPGIGLAADTTLTKVVWHDSSKTLVCEKKVGFNGSTCTETILDLAGNPIEGAWVDFKISNAAGGTLQPDTTAPVHKLGDNNWKVQTDADGKATVYVTNSDDNCMDIRAENIGTRYTTNAVGVERTFKIRPTTGTNCGTTTPVPPAGGGTGGNTGGNTGGSSSGAGSSVTVSLGGAPQPALQVSMSPIITAKPIVVAKNQARLFSVKVMQTKLGRYLVVNVKGTQKTAKVRFTITGKNGKVLKTITRTVRTNKAFKIADYKLPKTALSVRASVLTA
jgi:hypothetical protein